MKRNALLLVLLVSLAFNLGFAAQLVLGWSNTRPVGGETPDVSQYPEEFIALCDKLQDRLDGLRVEQAEYTRHLAELMAASEVDSEAISACLDDLSRTERAIKGIVIETVLAQRATLSDEERERFCGHVRHRLCDPWVNCRPSGDCQTHKHHHDQHEKTEEPSCSDQQLESNANGRHL